MISRTEIIVRYAETDQMGIAHHSNYAIWFEAARTDLIKKMGMSYSQMEKNGVLVPLLELECKYMVAARYEDVLTVEAKVSKVTLVKIEFAYQVFRKEDNILLAKGRSLHGLVDSDLKPVHMRRDKPEIYQMMVNAMEEL